MCSLRSVDGGRCSRLHHIGESREFAAQQSDRNGPQRRLETGERLSPESLSKIRLDIYRTPLILYEPSPIQATQNLVYMMLICFASQYCHIESNFDQAELTCLSN